MRTEITYEYYCVLRAHSWSRGKAFSRDVYIGTHYHHTHYFLTEG